MLKILLKKYWVYTFAGITSIVLACLVAFYQQPFGVDGIIYLNAAKTFLQHGLKASMQIYPWPFYSILIAITAKIFSLSILNAAYVLNTILDIVTACAFVAILKKLGAKNLLQLLGVLLLITNPYVNHFRIHILRGHGYYAFTFLAIFWLMQYATTRNWRYAISWSIAMIIAILFRIEGVILLAGLPLILFLQPTKNLRTKISFVGFAYIIPIIIMLLFIPIHLILYHKHALALVGRMTEISQQLQTGIISAWHNFSHTKELLKTDILSSSMPAGHGATYFLTGGILGSLIGTITEITGVLYILLFLFCIWKNIINCQREIKNIWLMSLGLTLIIPLWFFLQGNFLSGRYVALFSLLVFLSIPFALQKIYANWKERKPGWLTGSKWIFPLIIIWVLLITLDGIGHFGPSKTYIITAGRWIKNHTPTTSKLCCNDPQLFYYADRPGILNSDIKKLMQYKCDYLALKIPRYAHQSSSLHNAITNFKNHRGDAAYIFKIKT
jgi:hypothetical protein